MPTSFFSFLLTLLLLLLLLVLPLVRLLFPVDYLSSAQFEKPISDVEWQSFLVYTPFSFFSILLLTRFASSQLKRSTPTTTTAAAAGRTAVEIEKKKGKRKVVADDHHFLSLVSIQSWKRQRKELVTISFSLLFLRISNEKRRRDFIFFLKNDNIFIRFDLICRLSVKRPKRIECISFIESSRHTNGLCLSVCVR